MFEALTYQETEELAVRIYEAEMNSACDLDFAVELNDLLWDLGDHLWYISHAMKESQHAQA